MVVTLQRGILTCICLNITLCKNDDVKDLPAALYGFWLCDQEKTTYATKSTGGSTGDQVSLRGQSVVITDKRE